MTDSPSAPPPTPSAGPTGGGIGETLAPLWRWVEGLRVTRSSERWVGGVAGGLAQRWRVDPLVVRGAVVALCLLGGVGLVAYAVAWLLLPEPDGRIHLRDALAGRFDQAQVGAAVMLLIGLGPADWVGDSWGGGWVWGLVKALGWLTVLGLVAWYLADRHAAKGSPPPAAPTATTPNSQDSRSAPTQSAPTSALDTTIPSPLGSVEPVYGWTTDSDAPVDPTPAPTSTTPTTPKSQGPGRVITSLVTALAILAAAGILLADRANLLTPTWTLALGTLLVLLGFGLVLAGLSGRRGGGLSFLAIVGLILAPSTLMVDAGGDWNAGEGWNVGSTQWAPGSAQEAGAGVTHGLGELRVDLTDLDLTDTPIEVPIQVGAGELTVLVPSGTEIAADISLLAGQVTWNVAGEQLELSGTQPGRDADLGDPASADLVLRIAMGAGEITIEEENA